MRSLTKEEFDSEFLAFKEFSPGRTYRTYAALKERSDGIPFPVVVKEIDEKRSKIYEALTQTWNPHLAETYEVLSIVDSENPVQTHYAVITEYVCAEGSSADECISLTDFVLKNGPLKEDTALFICSQICEGLKELHKMGFIHRDLKPDNIMVSKYDPSRPSIKIIDLGGSKCWTSHQHADTTVIGTLGYQPPESLSLKTTNQADIYSVGCILNFMLTGCEPGIRIYNKNQYIVNIIEHATNEDPSHRYSTVTNMQKEVDHELRTKPLDKIPIVRSLPGFRTHTLWKEIVALLAYPSIILFAEICFDQFSVWYSLEIQFFYIVVPMIIIFNIGNLLRFFPKRLRQNNHLYLMVRTTIILAAIMGPSLVDVLTGR